MQAFASMGGGRAPLVGESEPGPHGRGPAGVAGSSTHEEAFAEFKRSVLERQVNYLVGVKKRTFFPDIPDSELEKIEPGTKHRMRREAAHACRALLSAARDELAQAQGGGDRAAGKTSAIGVQSAYRNFREDTAAWNSTFRQYYQEMVDGGVFEGHELGSEARQHMLRQMISYKAPPGYSNHSNGMAVDFNTRHGKIKYAAKKAQNAGWKKTWLHHWLVEHAAEYGFKPLATEAWHWDFDPSLRSAPQGIE